MLGSVIFKQFATCLVSLWIKLQQIDKDRFLWFITFEFQTSKIDGLRWRTIVMEVEWCKKGER